MRGRGVGAIALVVTLVDDETSLGVTRGGVLANFSTGCLGAITTLPTLFFFGSTLSGSWLIASIIYRTAAHAGGGVVDHPVDAEDAVLDGLLGDNSNGVGQLYGLSDEVVAVDGAEHSLEVAQAAFGGIDSLHEAESLPVVIVADIREIAESLGTVPLVENAPGVQQKHRYRMEGHVASSGGGIDNLSQDCFKGTEVDEAQGEIKEG
jgi:hypothetical protein